MRNRAKLRSRRENVHVGMCNKKASHRGSCLIKYCMDYTWTSAAQPMFYACHSKAFLFLPIAKCGSTSVKRLIVDLDDISGNRERPHDLLGFSPRVGRVICPDDFAQLSLYSSYRRFSVYRDPVERVLSCFRDKIMGGNEPHLFFEQSGLINISLSRFLEKLPNILGVRPKSWIDEHLRPFSWDYSQSHLQDLVELSAMNAYFDNRYGVTLPALNESRSALPQVTAAQADFIKELYWEDYRFIGRMKEASGDISWTND